MSMRWPTERPVHASPSMLERAAHFYSDAQARDEHGRWASGAGGAPDVTGAGAPKVVGRDAPSYAAHLAREISQNRNPSPKQMDTWRSAIATHVTRLEQTGGNLDTGNIRSLYGGGNKVQGSGLDAVEADLKQADTAPNKSIRYTFLLSAAMGLSRAEGRMTQAMGYQPHVDGFHTADQVLTRKAR